MIGEPRVSVVIPNYNQTRYLAGAIRSALNQSMRPLEVIVVDDGSTDGCRDVVSAFGARVRYCHQPNQGLAAARNTGITAARGEFVGLLDADDEWCPGFLAAFESLAARRPEATVYYCSARAMDERGEPLPVVLGGPPRAPHAMRQQLLRANFLIPSTIVLRREAAQAVGLFDASLRSCEDWDLWLRLLPSHVFVGMPECLVRYRLHTDSLSADPAGMRTAARAVIARHFGEDDGRWAEWLPEKQAAYGGLYRFLALLEIQRSGDWPTAEAHAERALLADPTMGSDADFFYALAHGRQPLALRGTREQLDLEGNADAIVRLVRRACASPSRSAYLQTALATAFHALGLVAYNTGHYPLSRRYLLMAARQRPALLSDRVVAGDLVKSFVMRWVAKDRGLAGAATPGGRGATASAGGACGPGTSS